MIAQSPHVHDDRIKILNDAPPDSKGKYVLYWMQQAERTRYNHALELAIEKANELHQPLLVCFSVMDDYPEANLRHYAFLIEGLRDVHAALKERGILFVVKHGPASTVALHYAKHASVVVCDRGYLRHQRRWRDEVADGANKTVIQVETDVVVPVETASDKHEYGARTIRPKIHKHWEKFLVEVPEITPKKKSLNLDITGDLDVPDVEGTLKKLKIDRSVNPVTRFTGGQNFAAKSLEHFLEHDLNGFATDRNEPAVQRTSLMSGHLHFGHISPLELALSVKNAKGISAADKDSYLEELIVRRELSMNFAQFEPKYDSYDGLPTWAKKTLAEHRNDKRENLYTLDELESAKTHDPYWNAAQIEMTRTGFMHNYMRMYWGKKILEWTPSPQTGFEQTLHLNNKYFLCGRNPNSFANVAWIYGLHDRPWGPERKIFGLIRYMNAAGLERKFDIDKYVARIALLS